MDPMIADHQKLNFQHTPTMVLPPETLSQIFQESIKPSVDRATSSDVNDGMFNKLRILQVCSRWRQVALSSPSFWVHFSSSFHNLKTMESLAHILGLHLRHSGSLPLHIVIVRTGVHTPLNYGTDGVLIHESIDAELVPALGRVKALRLDHLSFMGFVGLFQHASHLTGLESLCIEGLSQPVRLAGCPSLHNLTIVNSSHAEISVNAHIIHTLNLESVPVDLCVRLLFECPNLESYSMTEPMNPITHDIHSVCPGHRVMVVLSKMKEFTWTLSGSDWDNLIWGHLDLPAITDMIWHTDPAGFDPTQEGGGLATDRRLLKGFCERLGSLKHLELDLADLFRWFPERLTIESCFMAFDSWDKVFDFCRDIEPYHQEDGGLQKPFPKLARFDITIADGEDDTPGAVYIADILESLGNRVRAGLPTSVMFIGLHDIGNIDMGCINAAIREMLDNGSLVIKDWNNRFIFDDHFWV
ncbi:hypothetical protein NP233_g6716 [Leucocoprinus birnbaumii]|uniref:F-box domain-containing protein n=1 Tax=Leucocoprinus birnbaumii TaxID=56174 RepID=A0AAD5VQL5_9AGAR|nr:hypothetical protein NP233_g6716 [Leucocoprinus birnbaumii]